MAKPRGRSLDLNDLHPEQIVVLPKCKVKRLVFDERLRAVWQSPFFEVESEGETYRIRIPMHDQDAVAWVAAHEKEELTLNIFPYEWEVKGTTGVVNFFVNGATKPKQEGE